MDDPGEHLEERALAGPVWPDDRERLTALDVQVDVAQRPELVALAAPEHLPDRVADGRLAGEAKVVADADVTGVDREVRAGIHPGRRRFAGHQMTFAKFGSSRLNAYVVNARRMMLATSSAASDRKSGRPGDPFSVP